MRIHALESSGGLTYAEMGRFATADGTLAGHELDATAAVMVDGKPARTQRRNYVSDRAHCAGHALNIGYDGTQLSRIQHRDRDRTCSSRIGFTMR